mmetsp:Transcript_2086/g.2835  ORF Transcript_2086/g.2835 Transcript_2086/m.2835 type:complete len:305 (-) Transcript_2086:4-918(-)
MTLPTAPTFEDLSPPSSSYKACMIISFLLSSGNNKSHLFDLSKTRVKRDSCGTSPLATSPSAFIFSSSTYFRRACVDSFDKTLLIRTTPFCCKIAPCPSISNFGLNLLYSDISWDIFEAFVNFLLPLLFEVPPPPNPPPPPFLLASIRESSFRTFLIHFVASLRSSSVDMSNSFLGELDFNNISSSTYDRFTITCSCSPSSNEVTDGSGLLVLAASPPTVISQYFCRKEFECVELSPSEDFKVDRGKENAWIALLSFSSCIKTASTIPIYEFDLSMTMMQMMVVIFHVNKRTSISHSVIHYCCK